MDLVYILVVVVTVGVSRNVHSLHDRSLSVSVLSIRNDDRDHGRLTYDVPASLTQCSVKIQRWSMIRGTPLQVL